MKKTIIILVCVAIAVMLKETHASSSLVISEIYGGGGNSGAVFSNDFVVIFNPTLSDVDVNGWSLQYASATGTPTTWSVGILATESTTIPPGGYFLVRLQSGGSSGGYIGTPDASATSINLNSTAGKLALCNSTNALNSGGVSGCATNTDTIVDLVGYGLSANCSESSPTANLSSTTSAQRNGNGCVDTDDNGSDFTVAAVITPRNSSSPAHSCSGGSEPLDIITQPQNRANNGATAATFSVMASGSGPYFYQWQKAGFGNLSNGGKISGADSATLTINNVLKADEGYYLVTITNSNAESVTSQPAQLTVIEPIILSQLTDHTNVPGDTLSLYATVAGSSPLDFTWYRNDSPVLSGTSHSTAASVGFTLEITNAQTADSGNYYLVVFNSYGAVTSVVVSATVISTPTTRLARWTYNGNSVSSITPEPNEGTGTAALIGDTTASFTDGSPGDPGQAATLINNGWNTTTYPAASANNKTAGVQFHVSTEGHQDIMATWEQRHSNTASKYARFRYSTDGTIFIDGPAITMVTTNNSFVFYSVNLSGVTDANNDPDFTFQIVTEFEDTATGSGNSSYVGTAGNYSAGGTIRFDLVSVYGNTLGTLSPIPLHIEFQNNNAVLTWENPAFSLQSAADAAGNYTAIEGATSPYTNAMNPAPKYFRLFAAP